MFVLDRKKDMIVSDSFNIFPREVEDVLSPAKGAKPNADELINLVKAKTGSAHAPKHIKFVSELPMTGKVDKVLKAGF
jgi:fatty-acyl-CoA synthase